MTQKLSKNSLGRRNAHNADRIWTVSGCGKAFAKYTFLHVAVATKSIVSFTCQQAWLASSWKILVAEVSNAQEDWAENHSSRRSILLARWRFWHQNFQLTRQLNLLATYCDDVCGFCVGWLITVMFTLYCRTALATCGDTKALWNRAYIMFTHITTVISAHMSNTLDQIPVDKTWSPMESSGKMKPEVKSSALELPEV